MAHRRPAAQRPNSWRCLNPKLSRSAIHRCLQRQTLSAPSPDKPPLFQTDTPAGFIHADAEYLPPSGRQLRYAYVAIDRATRLVDPEILRDRHGATATVSLARPRGRFRLLMHTS